MQHTEDCRLVEEQSALPEATVDGHGKCNQPVSADPLEQGKAGRTKGSPSTQRHWAVRVRLQLAQRTRDLALFNLAIDSKLYACDLVKLRVNDDRPLLVFPRRPCFSCSRSRLVRAKKIDPTVPSRCRVGLVCVPSYRASIHPLSVLTSVNSSSTELVAPPRIAFRKSSEPNPPAD